MECTQCKENSQNIHVIFIDELYRTYILLCDECLQKYSAEWRETHNEPVREYTPDMKYLFT